jgi:hypothetical protein
MNRMLSVSSTENNQMVKMHITIKASPCMTMPMHPAHERKQEPTGRLVQIAQIGQIVNSNKNIRILKWRELFGCVERDFLRTNVLVSENTRAANLARIGGTDQEC